MYLIEEKHITNENKDRDREINEKNIKIIH